MSGGKGRDEGAILCNLVSRRVKSNIVRTHGVETNQDVSLEGSVINDVEIITEMRLKGRQRQAEENLAARHDDFTRETTNIDVWWRGRDLALGDVRDSVENVRFDDVDSSTRIKKGMTFLRGYCDCGSETLKKP